MAEISSELSALSCYDQFNGIDDGLDDDYDFSKPLSPLIPMGYASTFNNFCPSTPSHHHDHFYDHHSDEILDSHILELFFNNIIDEELEGEITVCQWIQFMKSAECIHLSEKQMCTIFKYVDGDDTGYIDSVDFVSFCKDKKCKIHKLQTKLINRIHSKASLFEHIDELFIIFY